MTLSEAFERHRQDRIVFANMSRKTEEQYIYTGRSLQRFLEQDIELDELTFDIVRDWKNSLEKRGLVSGTIRGYIVNLRVVLAYMRSIGEACLEPERIPIPKRVDRAPHVLSEKEIRHLIKVALTMPGATKRTRVRNAAIISLLYSSGIRVSEMCALNRSQIKEDTFTVYGKGGKSRMAVIDQRARKYLDMYLSYREDDMEPLFTEQNSSKRLAVSSVQGQFRRLSRHSDLGTMIHPHTIRHSYATNLMKNGCHIYPLSRLMGHSNIATTQTYFRLYDPELVAIHKQYHSI